MKVYAFVNELVYKVPPILPSAKKYKTKLHFDLPIKHPAQGAKKSRQAEIAWPISNDNQNREFCNGCNFNT